MATGGVSADTPTIVSLVEGHQHVLVVALTELGHLMVRLGTAVAASFLTPAQPGLSSSTISNDSTYSLAFIGLCWCYFASENTRLHVDVKSVDVVV